METETKCSNMIPCKFTGGTADGKVEHLEAGDAGRIMYAILQKDGSHVWSHDKPKERIKYQTYGDFDRQSNTYRHVATQYAPDTYLVPIVGGVADGREVTLGKKVYNDMWIDKEGVSPEAMIYMFTNPHADERDYERYWYDGRDESYHLFEWDIDFLGKDESKHKYGSIHNRNGECNFNVVQAHFESGTLNCQFTDLNGKPHIDEGEGKPTHVEIKMFAIPLTFVPNKLTPSTDHNDPIYTKPDHEITLPREQVG